MRTIALVLALALASVSGIAETHTDTEGNTPNALRPGGPAGTFALSGLDSVDPFGGGLSIRIPLLQVGGRGESGYTMSLPVYRKWRIEAREDSGLYYHSARTNLSEASHWWGDSRPPLYSPGIVIGRRVGENMDDCGGFGEIYTNLLTRLTFVGGDGSEIELVDVDTDGQIKPGYCNGVTHNRKKVFRSKSGENVTFFSDSDIYDDRFYRGGIPYQFLPTGYLFFKNGLRYRIANGLVTEIRDRNGNLTTLTYDIYNQLTQVEDPTKRIITIGYTSSAHTITYKGNGGTNRNVVVNFTAMGNRLYSGFSLQDYYGLFGSLGGGSDQFNPIVVSTVGLPNGQSYGFHYNSHGEVAQLTLPTGGQIRFTHAGGPGSGMSTIGYGPWNYHVYRRVTKREVYPSGSFREGYIDYSASESAASGSDITTYGIYSNLTSTMLHKNDAGTTLRKEVHYFYGGPGTVENYGVGLFRWAKWRDGRSYKTEIRTGSDVGKLRTERTWVRRPCETGEVCLYVVASGWLSDEKFATHDTRVTDETFTLLDGTSGSEPKSKVAFLYDKYNNVTHREEYNFGAGAVGTLARKTVTNYLTSGYDTVGATASATTHIRNLPSRAYLYEGSSTLVSDTLFYYDDYSMHALAARTSPSQYNAPSNNLRGNRTSTQQWVSGSTWITTTNIFDILGNLIEARDGRNNATKIDFTDNFSTGTTLGGLNSWAYPKTVQNAANIYTCSAFDYYLGKPTSVRNQSVSACNSGVLTTAAYNDSLDRLSETIAAFGTTYANRTYFTYSDSPGNLYVTANADKAILFDGAIITTTLYDGLGRTKEERLYEGGGAYIATLTQYDGRGRVWRVSNPYRPASESLYWNATTYDELDRPTITSLPDGTSTTQNYLGNRTESVDQAGKRWHRYTDALSRLTQVAEAPNTYNLNTYYSYTAHDKLRTVCQGGTLSGSTCSGGQSRTFTFDGLGRMLTANNPESGTSSYVYDNASNAYKITDARGVITCFGSLSGSTCTANGFDSINRPTVKRYSDGTPQVTYTWDTQFLGELTSVANTHSTTAYEYSPDASVNKTTQTTNGTPYVIQYDHYLNGAPKTVTYPSGRVITYAIPDDAGRLIQATGVKSGELNRTYVSEVIYASHGPVKRMRLGGLDRYYQITVNPRLQTTFIQFGTNASPSAYLALTYGYGSTDNNGNVLSQSINAGGTVFSQTYGYDDINRLKTFTESSTAQTYCYDRYGNRAMLNPSYIVASALTPQVGSCTTNGNDPNLPFTNNRTNNGNHDAAGNVRWDGATTYAFDAENRITSSTRTVGSLSTIVNYKYDGDGRRVRVEVTGGASTNFIYDAGGKLLAEYNSQNYPESGTRFRIGDHLGSTRLLFDLSGNILQRFDYLPFGEELLTSARTTALKYGVASSVKQRFTGQMRDGETNLDYFNARYLSPNQGRFTSPDLPLIDQNGGSPQSWNLYGYARNNPLRLSDPTGRSCVYNDGDTNKTNPIGDNGDGYGCSEIGVGAEKESTTKNGGVKAPPTDKPPIEPPPGNGPNGEPNEWERIPGSDSKPYGPQFQPKYPVPGMPGGSQPKVWWDAEDGWWSHEDGKGNPRGHYDRWGNRVNQMQSPGLWQWIKSIPPRQVAEMGTGAILIYLIVSEGSRLYPPRNLVPVP